MTSQTLEATGSSNEGPVIPGPSPFVAMTMLGVLALAVVWWGGVSPMVQPPPVIPASAPDQVFSAERAREHLKVIASEPRPVGSRGHALSRDYLLEELRGLGLNPEVQRTIGMRQAGDAVVAAAVSNIVTRIPGTDSTGAVVLMAHYDSVPHSPGATDAGNGVAAILETARAIEAGAPMPNDVVLLITDAEEVGLLGAQAYVDAHPLASRTGIVLNAEGRGHAGPVFMFRTTDGNGRMIRTLARTIPDARADSLSRDLFRVMPNDTDLSVFHRAGYAGMDFANVRGLTHYHSPLDNPETADPRSLQHHGDYMLGLARAFAHMDLADLHAPDRVYFNVPLAGLIHYPAAASLPLAVMALLLVVGSGLRACRQGGLRPGKTCLAVLTFAGLLLIVPVLAMMAWWLIRLAIPEYLWFSNGAVYHEIRYLTALGLLAVASYMAVAWGLGRWFFPTERLHGVLGVWAVIGLASAVWLPGAAYLFLWPTLITTVGALIIHRRLGGLTRGMVLVLLALPVVYFVVPVVVGMTEALTLNMIVVPVTLLVLGMGLLTLQLDFLSSVWRLKLPAAMALTGVGVLVWALLGTGFDEDRPRPNAVEYIANVTAGEAYWYSLDPEPDAWTRQYLGPDTKRVSLPGWAPGYLSGAATAWARPSPVLRDDAPDAEYLGDAVVADGREVRLHITSPAGSYATVIEFEEGTEARDVWIGDPDAPVAVDGNISRLIYFGLDEAGVGLTFTTAAGRTAELKLRSSIPGLPDLDYKAAVPRSSDAMAAGPTADRTRLQRTVRIPEVPEH